MKTENEINELAVKFAEFVADDHCRGCDESDVVRTAETVEHFKASLREYRKLDTDVFKGMTVTIFEKSQRQKGEERTDLYILDVEESVRLVMAL